MVAEIMETENKPERTWYERVFETTDLTFSNPELKPYLDVDQYPEWLVNVMAELFRQGLHLTPPRDMAVITPKKLGMSLGQKCANFYAIGNQIQTGIAALENPQNAEKLAAFIEQLDKNKENPVVASGLHSMEVAGSLIEELAKGGDEFEKIVHNAFKEALDQPSHAEAVLFFQGFAQGIASPGILPGRLAQSTDATPIYYKMYFHWQEVDRLHNVTELYDFLLKVGISKPMLGDIDRLRTLCTRIKYAPGKRGRPTKIKK
jgi:hypothetical protein